MKRIVAFAVSASALATGALASTTAGPPLRTKAFPEQAAYCQPALEIMNQNFDGLLSDEAAIKAARAQILKCRSTNKLGAHLSAAQVENIAGNRVAALAEARAALAMAPNESEAHRRLCILLPRGAEKTSTCEGMKRFAAQNVLINFTLG